MNIVEIENTLNEVEESIKNIRNQVDSIKAEPCVKGTHSFNVVGIISMERLMQEYIQYALEQCHGNQSQCAELLGWSRSTLWRNLKTEQ